MVDPPPPRTVGAEQDDAATESETGRGASGSGTSGTWAGSKEKTGDKTSACAVCDVPTTYSTLTATDVSCRACRVFPLRCSPLSILGR
ncbi:hypothetical protein [Streptomyces sp. NPDC002785]|uniref:hypothetical protein n=1 Tax=Streptomyces sp. NPDC002785 TaxID=3154543 RepID=UPI00331833D8